MKVLGISGRYRDAAAALSVDGHVIAAASEDCFTRVPGAGYTQTGGFPTHAASACLQSAGLSLSDLDQLTIVNDEGHGDTGDPRAALFPDGQPAHAVSIGAVLADAIQAAASGSGARAVLVCSTEPAAIASFVSTGGGLESRRQFQGADQLLSAARSLARTVGMTGDDPFRAIDRLSVGGEPEFENELKAAIQWSHPAGVSVDDARLSHFVATLEQPAFGRLADVTSLNVRLQERRRAVAASFTCSVAQLIRDAADSVCAEAHLETIAFGGGVFSNPRLNTELRRLMGDGLSLAAVPEPAGRALGAALSVTGMTGDRLQGLALGPAFSDPEIKRTLDNCRLDYVYEPDWRRLFERASKMLSQGKVVAWFQGAMGFGPRAMGTRSILCDPSSRYARQNMNEYLRHVPLDEPLPVVFAPSAAAGCLADPLASPFTVLDSAVKSEWRDRLRAALDWRHDVRVHGVSSAQAPELCQLLECHLERTGVPALIETNLCGPGEPIACVPRDAVKTVYSSAIDALIIGRFVLMKDYWLLRNNAD